MKHVPLIVAAVLFLLSFVEPANAGKKGKCPALKIVPQTVDYFFAVPPSSPSESSTNSEWREEYGILAEYAESPIFFDAAHPQTNVTGQELFLKMLIQSDPSTDSDTTIKDCTYPLTIGEPIVKGTIFWLGIDSSTPPTHFAFDVKPASLGEVASWTATAPLNGFHTLSDKLQALRSRFLKSPGGKSDFARTVLRVKVEAPEGISQGDEGTENDTVCRELLIKKAIFPYKGESGLRGKISETDAPCSWGTD